MSRWSHGGPSASKLGTEGPATQTHGHSQLGWQGGPVDPVPALGASSGSHPGVLGDRVSAQEILREESNGSFFSGHWYGSPGLPCPCPIPPPQLPQVPNSPSQRRDSSLPKRMKWEAVLDACWLTGTVLRLGDQKQGRSPLSLQGESGCDPPSPRATHDGY